MFLVTCTQRHNSEGLGQPSTVYLGQSRPWQNQGCGLLSDPKAGRISLWPAALSESCPLGGGSEGRAKHDIAECSMLVRRIRCETAIARGKLEAPSGYCVRIEDRIRLQKQTERGQVDSFVWLSGSRVT